MAKRTVVIAAGLMAGLVLGAAPEELEKFWSGVKEFAQPQADAQREATLQGLSKAVSSETTFTKEQFGKLEALIRHREGFSAAKGDSIEEHFVAVEGTKQKFPLHVYVPPAYDPSKPAPLLVAMHGGPIPELQRAQKHAKGMIKDWKPAVKDAGWLVAAPVEATNSETGEINFKAVMAIIRFVQVRYNVDPDRIYLTGHSRGGFVSWIMGLINPDRFAGVAPDCGGEDYGENLMNAANLPVYNMQGKKDNQGNQNFILPKNARKNRDTLDALRKQFPALYEHQYRETELGHDPSVAHYPDAVTWFSARPRNNYPVTIRGNFGFVREDNQRLYWIEKMEGDKPILEANVDREKNEIHVSWKGVRKYRVYVHDRMLDLDRPLKIFTNGAVSFEGKIGRSPLFTLRHIHDSRDFGRIYANAIEITVP